MTLTMHCHSFCGMRDPRDDIPDLSVERVQDIVRDNLIPTFIPLANEMIIDDRKDLLEGWYGLSDNPSRLIWIWPK